MQKTFEEYLEEEFMESYVGTKDDYEDSLISYMYGLDVQEIIDLAEEWGSELLNNKQ